MPDVFPIDRRQFIAAGAAAALAGPACAATSSDDGGAILDSQAEWLLSRYPEEATAYGWDTGSRSALRSRLSDRSAASRAADRAAFEAFLAKVRAARQRAPSADLAIAEFVAATFVDLLGRYGCIDLDLRPTPYVVSQMNGAYYWMPAFLGEAHPIESSESVEAWFARLDALAALVDQETAQLIQDDEKGIRPPRFAIEAAVAQIRALRDIPAGQSPMIAPVVARAASRGLGDIAARAARAFGPIAAALTRQSDALSARLVGASDIAGVWRLPEGDAYYAAALQANTTVALSPDRMHRDGLDQCARLRAEIDVALAKAGLVHGDVATRMAELDRDPRSLAGNDEAGRARILDRARDILVQVMRRLPAAFRDPPGEIPAVAALAPELEAGSPLAFLQTGARGEGRIMLNLKAPAEIPLWRLPTLIHHEGLPGHFLQAAMLRDSGSLSRFRRLVRFSAYTEGYGLYAQQLADELGAYEDDPRGRVGYLQSELFRAARIVVDTGLHHKRWSREQAVAWMVEHGGELPGPTAREVMRYSVYPGQACSFTIGANAIVAVRERARLRQANRFDLQRFHDILLRSGPMPLDVFASIAEERLS